MMKLEEITPLQMGFVRKVYGIVGAQLLISVIAAANILQYKLIQEIAFVLFVPSIILSIVIEIILLVLNQSHQRYQLITFCWLHSLLLSQ